MLSLERIMVYLLQFDKFSQSDRTEILRQAQLYVGRCGVPSWENRKLKQLIEQCKLLMTGDRTA